jgi:hypothetical protein
MEGGAIGIKFFGARGPCTPETLEAMIGAANERRVYVACHSGSVRTGSDLNGLLESIEVAGKNHLHIAHINSYVRGMIKDPVEEVVIGLNALKGKRNIVSESYLSVINGTYGRVSENPPGAPVRPNNHLKKGGYESTVKGMEQAITDGWGQVVVEEGGNVYLLHGPEGVERWRERHGDVMMSFPVNVPEATFLCAVKKDETGRFIVDAISTDGGLWPRNVAVENGLALVRYKALTLEEFVTKASTVGAAMLGLPDKGHLGTGSDADITVLDLERGKAVMSMVGGKVIMAHGIVYGKGGTVITTKKGIEAARRAGLPFRQVDVEDMLIYSKARQPA